MYLECKANNMRIDAHQHFWNYNAEEFAWIDDSMQVIRKDFTPPMLHEILIQNKIDGCVTVQTLQTEEETNRLLFLADQYPFIKGVVGWIDLQAKNIRERLEHYQQFSTLKGFRHIVQSEQDPGFLLRPAFRNGIRHLQSMNYSYDILIYPHQFKMASEFVAEFPQQKFVLDHMAKPYIKKGLVTKWKEDIHKLAAFDNVWCKISGLVTEADWNTFTPEEIFPYIEIAFNAFGISRVMYGSDWPVCLLAADYGKVLNIVETFTSELSEQEKLKFFGKNAIQFYNLNN
jgi:L-fuconolactonase